MNKTWQKVPKNNLKSNFIWLNSKINLKYNLIWFSSEINLKLEIESILLWTLHLKFWLSVSFNKFYKIYTFPKGLWDLAKPVFLKFVLKKWILRSSYLKPALIVLIDCWWCWSILTIPSPNWNKNIAQKLVFVGWNGRYVDWGGLCMILEVLPPTLCLSHSHQHRKYLAIRTLQIYLVIWTN